MLDSQRSRRSGPAGTRLDLKRSLPSSVMTNCVVCLVSATAALISPFRVLDARHASRLFRSPINESADQRDRVN